MTFGDEDKDDETFNAELAELIEKAKDNGVPQVYLQQVIATFCKRHGRDPELAMRIEQ